MDANLNKGQQAILLAMIHPEPERGRGKKDETIKGAETAGSSYRRLAVAREIVCHAPDLAQQVLTKRMNFDEASESARKRRAESRTRDELAADIKERGVLDWCEEAPNSKPRSTRERPP
jgi:hypothetical protein